METIQGIKREVSAGRKEEGKCYHCGSDFDEIIVEAHGHKFCCTGCKTVYEILDEGGLHNYYGIEGSSGNKVFLDIGNKYAFLDNEDVQQGLLEFDDGGLARVKFYVPGIHCSSCIWLLENLHRLNKGVLKSTVNFLKKEVYIVYRNEDITLRQVVELLTSIGYEPAISLADFKKEDGRKEDKSFYYKLGMAGFAFGNIMLLSFPEYFDVQEYLNPDFKKLFGYLNLFLATPVFFYSSSDYFISAFKALKKKYINVDFPVSIGITVLYFRSAYEIISQTGPGFMDSFTMFVFLLLVGKWYQNRTYQALSFERNYKSYFPLAITKVTGNEEVPVPVETLKVGDVVKIRHHEIIPADGELLSELTMIDYSFVTGESTAVEKKKGEKIYAGGRQKGASVHVKILSPVSQSYLTRLWNQDVFAKDDSRYQSIVNKVSKYFTIFILAVAVFSFAYWFGEGVAEAIKIATAVLIIACPCALALTLPFTFGNTMTLFGRKRFYLKNAETVEKLDLVDTIVFDKTGTLTRSSDASVSWVGDPLPDDELLAVKALTSHSTHPLSKIIYAHIEGNEFPVLSGYEEFPSQGIAAACNGREIRVGSAGFTRYDGVVPEDLSSRVFVSVDGRVKGYFLIKKQYREGIEELLKRLVEEGYDIHLISGDNAAEMKNLSRYFKPGNMHFNQSPVEKLHYIESLQAAGKQVMMVGDGLNDAGALKQSDVGIAISDDVYNFTPACDAILDSEKFTSLDGFLGFSKTAMKVVRASFVISLLYNTIGLVFAVSGHVTPLFAAILMPLSSITVVTFITLSIRWLYSRVLL